MRLAWSHVIVLLVLVVSGLLLLQQAREEAHESQSHLSEASTAIPKPDLAPRPLKLPEKRSTTPGTARATGLIEGASSIDETSVEEAFRGLKVHHDEKESGEAHKETTSVTIPSNDHSASASVSTSPTQADAKQKNVVSSVSALSSMLGPEVSAKDIETGTWKKRVATPEQLPLTPAAPVTSVTPPAPAPAPVSVPVPAPVPAPAPAPAPKPVADSVAQGNEEEYEDEEDEEEGGNKDEKLHIKGPLAKGVFLLHDVCIEDHPSPWVEKKKGSCPHRPDLDFRIGKRIVIYNSKKSHTVKNMNVAGSGNRKNLWDISYEPGPPPKTHHYKSHPAFFVTTTCEANLHHFLVDQFFRIFGTMKKAGRLGHENKAMLYYRDDVHSFCRESGCHDPTRFQDILSTLSIRGHRAYFKSKSNVCYHEALLGTDRHGVGEKDVVNYVVRKMREEQGAKGECKDYDKRVIILQRSNRRLVNAEELAKEARSKGLSAEVVTFDNASIADQIATVSCCKLFIAVMGAGQQWVSFMRKGSTLMSIGWTNWKADYYESFARNAGVRFVGVSTNGKVTPNWEEPTLRNFLKGEKLTPAKKTALVQAKNKHVMKYSDVTLPVGQLTPVLCRVFAEAC